ncbi:MAG: NHLP leader peptide family RiPP precursor [Bacillota bacterium]
MSEMTRSQYEEQIVKKAQTDKEFKNALLANPKEALAKLGSEFPAEVEVKVIEESAKVVYLVLPFNPDELTDEQMDSVAGGICFSKGYCYTKICEGSFRVG